MCIVNRRIECLALEELKSRAVPERKEGKSLKEGTCLQNDVEARKKL